MLMSPQSHHNHHIILLVQLPLQVLVLFAESQKICWCITNSTDNHITTPPNDASFHHVVSLLAITVSTTNCRKKHFCFKVWFTLIIVLIIKNHSPCVKIVVLANHHINNQSYWCLLWCRHQHILVLHV